MKGAQEFISEAPSAIVQSIGQVSGLADQAENAIQGTAKGIFSLYNIM